VRVLDLCMARAHCMARSVVRHTRARDVDDARSCVDGGGDDVREVVRVELVGVLRPLDRADAYAGANARWWEAAMGRH